jgi:hypothetical protein
VGGCGSGSSSSSTAASTTTAKAESGSDGGSGKSAAGTSGDSSIQRYGGAAEGSEKAAVIAGAHGFLAAMASADYAGMCAHLAAGNRRELEAFGEGQSSSSAGCAAALKTLLSPGVAKEARAAAAAPITSVRIKGDTAFAIFTPKGGPASFLVVKREGDSWKSISVTPGTPLEPTAGQ